MFRYNALSFVYLIYLMLIPLFPEPTSTTMQGKIASASDSHARLRLCPPKLDSLPNIAVQDSLMRTSPSPEDLGMKLELAQSSVYEEKNQNPTRSEILS